MHRGKNETLRPETETFVFFLRDETETETFLDFHETDTFQNSVSRPRLRDRDFMPATWYTKSTKD